LDYQAESRGEVRHLRDSWGNQVKWYDARLGREEQYSVMTEMDVAGQTYAVLIPTSFADPHPYLFKYSLTDGVPALSPVESEDEWDQAVDAFSAWLDESNVKVHMV